MGPNVSQGEVGPNVEQGEEERATSRPWRRGEGQMLTKGKKGWPNVNQGERQRAKCQPEEVEGTACSPEIE